MLSESHKKIILYKFENVIQKRNYKNSLHCRRQRRGRRRRHRRRLPPRPSLGAAQFQTYKSLLYTYTCPLAARVYNAELINSGLSRLPLELCVCVYNNNNMYDGGGTLYIHIHRPGVSPISIKRQLHLLELRSSSRG